MAVLGLGAAVQPELLLVLSHLPGREQLSGRNLLVPFGLCGCWSCLQVPSWSWRPRTVRDLACWEQGLRGMLLLCLAEYPQNSGAASAAELLNPRTRSQLRWLPS